MSTVSKISFGESSFNKNNLSERHRKRPILSRISRMSDEEIIGASVKNANKEMEQSTAVSVLKNGPLMFVAAMPVVYGALAKGKLSSKVASAAQTFGVLAGAYALSKPFNSLEERIENKSGKVKKFNNEHPFVSTALSAAAFVGVAALALKGGKAAAGKLADNFRPAADELKEKLIKTANNIDKSKLGKLTDKVSGAARDFASKHPSLAKAAGAMATVLPVMGFMGGTLALANKAVDDRDEKAASNINKLLLMREFAKAALDDKEDDSFKSDKIDEGAED